MAVQRYEQCDSEVSGQRCRRRARVNEYDSSDGLLRQRMCFECFARETAQRTLYLEILDT